MPHDSPRTIHGTQIEILIDPPRGKVSHAVLDLDGTVSLLRDGWQDHMVPLMVEVLEECPRHESREELEKLVIDFVDHLTGKQTVYQMIRLADEIEKRGGSDEIAVFFKDALKITTAQIRRLEVDAHSGQPGLAEP